MLQHRENYRYNTRNENRSIYRRLVGAVSDVEAARVKYALDLLLASPQLDCSCEARSPLSLLVGDYLDHDVVACLYWHQTRDRVVMDCHC